MELNKANNLIFLGHASEDKSRVIALYNKLIEHDLNPWLDIVNLKPGDNWEYKIREAIQNSKVFLACLSSTSVSKNGFVQKELRLALDEASEKVFENSYLIPVLLDDIDVPKITVDTIKLSDFQASEVFTEKGLKNLILHLRSNIHSSEDFHHFKLHKSPSKKLTNGNSEETTSPIDDISKSQYLDEFGLSYQIYHGVKGGFIGGLIAGVFVGLSYFFQTEKFIGSMLVIPFGAITGLILGAFVQYGMKIAIKKTVFNYKLSLILGGVLGSLLAGAILGLWCSWVFVQLKDSGQPIQSQTIPIIGWAIIPMSIMIGIGSFGQYSKFMDIIQVSIITLIETFILGSILVLIFDKQLEIGYIMNSFGTPSSPLKHGLTGAYLGAMYASTVGLIIPLSILSYNYIKSLTKKY